MTEELRARIEQVLDDGHELAFLEPRDVFDAAIVGVAERFHDVFLLYSRSKVLAIFAEDTETDEDPIEAAIEHYQYNVVGGWIGETTPAFLMDEEDE